MSNIVNIPKKHKQETSAELMRLRAMLVSVRQQIDWIAATIDAMMPEHEGAARYKRQRSICSDRALTRDYLEGK